MTLDSLEKLFVIGASIVTIITVGGVPLYRHFKAKRDKPVVTDTLPEFADSTVGKDNPPACASSPVEPEISVLDRKLLKGRRPFF